MVRWWLIERITGWIVTVLLASWLYFLTDWLSAVSDGVIVLADALEVMRQYMERFRI